MKKFLTCLFFFGFFAFASAIVPAYYTLKVDSSSFKPSIVYAGNEVAIAVNVRNISNSVKISDVNLQLLTGTNFEPIETELYSQEILANQTKTFVFRVRAKDGIAAGNYVLSLKMQYLNVGEIVSDYATISVPVSEIYRVSIDSLRVSDYYPHIGEEVSVKARIKNTGSIEARNVVVDFSLIGATDFGKFIVLSETKRDLGSIQPGKDVEVEFKLKPSQKIEPGVYSFKVACSCLNCDSIVEQKFALHVYGYPELIVSGIDYSIKGKDTKNLVQGETFSLSVQLDNLGKEDAKKVEIEVVVDESIVGQRKAYVGSIESDDSSAGIFDFFVAENAKVGYHELQIIISYIDELGKLQKIEEKYSLYVSKMPEPSPYIPFVFIIVILLLVYLIIRMVLRQLAIRKL
ncbi:MAG: CARDB domain-containing protein [Candidatus Diapherotrites archaeon]